MQATITIEARGRPKREPRSQIGRWKGLDEDVSDDQVPFQHIQTEITLVVQLMSTVGFSSVCVTEQHWHCSFWHAADDFLLHLQQDITRGRGMVDSLYQAGGGAGGTHNAIMSSDEYMSQAARNLNNIEEGFYM